MFTFVLIKPSSLDGKSVLEPHGNQSVVRQPTAFKFEQPRISKPRFASQVDVNNELPKLITTHYFPKGKASACAKPHHMIAPGSSRYSSNDMVYNHYLEEAKKQTSKGDSRFLTWGNNEDEDNENDSDDISDEGDDDNNGNNGDDDDTNDDDKQEGDDTNDDDEETDIDRTESNRINIPIFEQSTTEYYEEEEEEEEEEEKIDDEETMYDDEDDEVTKELYEDVNLLNLENPSLANNEIASLMETLAHHATTVPENTSGFTTTIPLPPSFFNLLLQQATPTLTPTTSKAKTSFPSLLDFSSVFRFNDRVTNLEKDLSEIKRVDQDLIKEEVNTQLPQILPQAVSNFANPMIEKNVTESVEATVLTMYSSQPTSTYKAAASLFEFELTKILIDKMEKNKSYDKADYKTKLYDALVECYNCDKDLFDSYGEVFSLKRSRDEKDKDQDPSAG
ncbi:hypothetical protein Tco_0820748 [Tanacetum coccineum]|uniref:Uncharacterized protein n=1 Tax=Tanacetum coccineum TaxID=301880 RepID=A0ABQ5AEK9_9ASTR